MHNSILIGGLSCQELCYQVNKYCPDVIKKFAEIDTCKFYPSFDDHPECYQPEINCPKPEAPSYGSVEFNDLSPGSEAYYSCNLLFDLKGSTKRICQVTEKQDHSK